MCNSDTQQTFNNACLKICIYFWHIWQLLLAKTLCHKSGNCLVLPKESVLSEKLQPLLLKASKFKSLWQSIFYSLVWNLIQFKASTIQSEAPSFSFIFLHHLSEESREYALMKALNLNSKESPGSEQKVKFFFTNFWSWLNSTTNYICSELLLKI